MAVKTTVKRKEGAAVRVERIVSRHFEDIIGALQAAAQYESSYADAWKGADKRIALNARRRSARYLKLRAEIINAC